MRYLEYKERRGHGTFDYPVALYHVTPRHPRYQMVYHWHTECELIRVLSGALTLVLDGVVVKLFPGDIVFIGEGVLHGGFPQEDCHYDCLVLDLNLLLGGNRICARELAPILLYEQRIQILFPAGEERTSTYLEAMFASAHSKEKGSQLQFIGALCSFLAAVLRENLCQQAPGKGREQRELIRLKKVLSFIWSHYQEQVTLEDLARCSGMNSKYFCRFFRELTQRTPVEYLNYYRVECACEQMVITSKSITEIAHDCGFNDVSYFAKVFRRFKGLSPSQYARSSFAAGR